MTVDEIYFRARLLLDGLTPIDSDCGELCGAVCCKGNADEGMLLFPHEQAADEFTVRACKSGNLLVCEGRCNRDNRPLACIMFPLVPILVGDRVKVAVNAYAFRICPLAKAGGHIKYNIDFVRAVRRVGRLLSTDEECREFLRKMSDEQKTASSLLPDGQIIVSGRK